MSNTQTSDDSIRPANTAVRVADQRVHQPEPGLLNRYGQTLYQVPLTGDDLRLIHACSTWICRLQPAPDIRSRFVHLERQLARAHPMPTTPARVAHPERQLADVVWVSADQGGH
jgi:hypothetical protein